METPIRNFRCPDHVWARLNWLANEDGVSCSEIIRRLIERAYEGEPSGKSALHSESSNFRAVVVFDEGTYVIEGGKWKRVA